jgi:hypothetical protein
MMIEVMTGMMILMMMVMMKKDDDDDDSVIIIIIIMIDNTCTIFLPSGKIGELFVFNNVGRDKVDSAKAGR